MELTSIKTPLNFNNLTSCSTLQVDRVLKPGGIVGLVSLNVGPACVDSPSMRRASTCITDLFKEHGLPERIKLLEENYENLVLPYPTRRDHRVDMLTSWSLSDYLDVCMTFSQVNNLVESLGLSVEQGYDHVKQMLKGAGMTEQDEKSVYTWSQPSALVTATKH